MEGALLGNCARSRVGKILGDLDGNREEDTNEGKEEGDLEGSGVGFKE
jgi:hypothetical protein